MPLGGDHPGAGVLARDRLAAGERRWRRLRRALSLRAGGQGSGRGLGATGRREGRQGVTRQSNSGEGGTQGVIRRSNSGEAPSNDPLGPKLTEFSGVERIEAAFRVAEEEGRAAL